MWRWLWIDLSPLLPAVPPPTLTLILPDGMSSSSWTTMSRQAVPAWVAGRALAAGTVVAGPVVARPVVAEAVVAEPVVAGPVPSG